ncbi:MAG TPA: hypothetical protein VFH47_06165 [Candidatus Thermoplasmatota archaeon]|nr:hypothetical protein [Candidatus Thermoplasmatota archaeon]
MSRIAAFLALTLALAGCAASLPAPDPPGSTTPPQVAPPAGAPAADPAPPVLRILAVRQEGGSLLVTYEVAGVGPGATSFLEHRHGSHAGRSRDSLGPGRHEAQATGLPPATLVEYRVTVADFAWGTSTPYANLTTQAQPGASAARGIRDVAWTATDDGFQVAWTVDGEPSLSFLRYGSHGETPRESEPRFGAGRHSVRVADIPPGRGWSFEVVAQVDGREHVAPPQSVPGAGTAAAASAGASPAEDASGEAAAWDPCATPRRPDPFGLLPVASWPSVAVQRYGDVQVQAVLGGTQDQRALRWVSEAGSGVRPAEPPAEPGQPFSTFTIPYAGPGWVSARACVAASQNAWAMTAPVSAYLGSPTLAGVPGFATHVFDSEQGCVLVRPNAVLGPSAAVLLEHGVTSFYGHSITAQGESVLCPGPGRFVRITVEGSGHRLQAETQVPRFVRATLVASEDGLTVPSPVLSGALRLELQNDDVRDHAFAVYGSGLEVRLTEPGQVRAAEGHMVAAADRLGRIDAHLPAGTYRIVSTLHPTVQADLVVQDTP